MQDENWIDRLNAPSTAEEVGLSPIVVFIQRYFKLKHRNTNIKREVHCGILHFISVAFILSVNSTLLSENATYQANKVAAATALSTGVSCIICGILSNLPFVLAPTTSTSLYYALYLQNHNMSVPEGNMAVLLLAVLFTLCGFRPVAIFISNLIPFVMKVGVCLGVGLLIALEALYEIGLVQTGEHTVLDIGQFNTEIYIAMFSFIVIGLALHYRIRGAFLIGMVCGTFLYWIALGSSSDWPPSRITVKSGDLKAKIHDIAFGSASSTVVLRLVFDLYVIGVILLNGLAHGLAETAHLKRADNTLPRGKWLYASCGVGTLLSAFIGSGPIMISPESAPGIKAGARTGLSTVVCGLCFLISLVFCPLFAAVPTSGTSPILLMIGMFMFENAGKVDWSNISEALPVFIMAIFVPFTYSIFNGVVFGFGVYLILLVSTSNSTLSKKFRCCRKKLLPTTITRNIRSWASWGDGKRSRSLSLSGSVAGSAAYSTVSSGELGDDAENSRSPLFVRNRVAEDRQSSGKGKWKSLVHQPGHLTVEEVDSDEDGDEEHVADEDFNENKILSFSLSAIGDQIQDDLGYNANDNNNVRTNYSGPGIIDIEQASSSSSLASYKYNPPTAAVEGNIPGPWNRSPLQVNKPINERAILQDHSNEGDEDVEVVL